MQVTFLGTSCMVPTKDRNVSGTFLSYKDEGILFDCGEGTRRQMKITGIKRTSVKKILITHWHGDHCSGMIGLLQTLGNEENFPTIEIFGPPGTEERVGHMLKTVVYNEKSLNLKVTELDPKGVETFYDTEEYFLQCAAMKHGTACLAYTFVVKEKLNVDPAKMAKAGVKPGPHLRKVKEGKTIVVAGKKITPEMICTTVKGKKFAYVMDTRPCENAYLIAQDADVLVADSTYTHDLADKARKYHHMTAREAAQVAAQANVKKLILTHFSQRYKSGHPLEEDARTVFDNSFAAKDFMKITI